MKVYYILFMAAIFSIFTTSCDKESIDPYWDGEMRITMKNFTDEPAHLFLGGMQFSSANKVQPGELISYYVHFTPIAGKEKPLSSSDYEPYYTSMHAGRNGVIISTLNSVSIKKEPHNNIVIFKNNKLTF